MNAQSRIHWAGCQREPRPARPSPDSLLPNTPNGHQRWLSFRKMAVVQKEKMAVVRLAACVMEREEEHGEGPASYRGLGLRHAMAGFPRRFRAGLRAASLRFQRAI